VGVDVVQSVAQRNDILADEAARQYHQEDAEAPLGADD
jgi:heme exporter protein D